MDFDCKIRFRVQSQGGALHLQVRFDSDNIFDADVSDPVDIEHDFPDKDQEHCLQFILSGKHRNHTQLDNSGKIIRDRVLIFSDLHIDDIECTLPAWQASIYHHDFNGTENTVQDTFFGIMGCNGTTVFKFQGPVYRWMLDHV